MSDRAAMLRETVEAFTDLRAMFDELTEEQASRVWLGVIGVRDLVIQTPRPEAPGGCDAAISQAPGSPPAARDPWAPGSFWGARYPSPRDGSRTAS